MISLIILKFATAVVFSLQTKEEKDLQEIIDFLVVFDVFPSSMVQSWRTVEGGYGYIGNGRCFFENELHKPNRNKMYAFLISNFHPGQLRAFKGPGVAL